MEKSNWNKNEHSEGKAVEKPVMVYKMVKRMRNRTSTKKKKNVNGKSEIKIIKKHRVIDKV